MTDNPTHEAATGAWLDAARPVPDIRTALPGPLAQQVLDRDGAVTSPSLPRAYPLAPKRAYGSVIEDMDGNYFLDFNAGIAVNSTGHCHPKVVAAVQQQATQLLHYSASDFFLPIYSETVQKLAATLPISGPVRGFLTNSGAEAVEGALKLARYATGRQNVISFYGAFHGRTMGAVTLTASKAKYHKGFGPLLPGVHHAPFWPAPLDYFSDVLFRSVVDPKEVAAIFLEPIQGEGGYIVPDAEWVRGLRALCDEHGILLIADEVQSGMGRTGTMWAIELFDVEPDILITAKGIASGLPLGGFFAREEIMTKWSGGAHGSTYGGSPIPCAAALATLDVIESEGLIARGAQVGERILASLREVQAQVPELVVEVRGSGLMIGVEFPDGELAEEVQNVAFAKGLLVLGCGENAVRMSPPLTITDEEAVTGVAIFAEAIRDVAAARGLTGSTTGSTPAAEPVGV